jgi:hypothetical protein
MRQRLSRYRRLAGPVAAGLMLRLRSLCPWCARGRSAPECWPGPTVMRGRLTRPTATASFAWSSRRHRHEGPPEPAQKHQVDGYMHCRERIAHRPFRRYDHCVALAQARRQRRLPFPRRRWQGVAVHPRRRVGAAHWIVQMADDLRSIRGPFHKMDMGSHEPKMEGSWVCKRESLYYFTMPEGTAPSRSTRRARRWAHGRIVAASWNPRTTITTTRSCGSAGAGLHQPPLA